MHKIYLAVRAWLTDILRPDRADDPLARMSARELADLPAHHPLCDYQG